MRSHQGFVKVDGLFVLGITGPTGSGKTVVSDYFAQCGIKVIDADKLARLVVEPEKPCLNELVSEFSDVILNPDGALNRRRLAEIAFATEAKALRLNEIVHPYVIDETYEILRDYLALGGKMAVIDAPLLFESDMNRMCDHVAVVLAERQLRLERIIARDAITYEHALARINAQKEDSYYISRADSILSSDKGRETLLEQAEALLKKLSH